jgi:hypothetical protein
VVRCKLVALELKRVRITRVNMGLGFMASLTKLKVDSI